MQYQNAVPHKWLPREKFPGVLLHPVEFADGLVTVRTGVDDVLASVNAEWDQTATKPQAKKIKSLKTHLIKDIFSKN